ncbi:MAG: Clp protease N-terminal domain-containing protein [Candidatus Krumholzibacteria bacterium]|nr:Clp protease N-terminal domain-containing protein [Candidatus Krumholzibacteria bacterium]
MNSHEFEQNCWDVIRESINFAIDSGDEVVGTPHLFAAFLAHGGRFVNDSLAEAGFDLEALRIFFGNRSPSGNRTEDRLPPVTSRNLEEILSIARKMREISKEFAITERILWEAFRRQGGGKTGDWLFEAFGIDLLTSLIELFLPNGDINADLLEEEVGKILGCSARHAKEAGNGRLMTPDLFYGLLEHGELAGSLFAGQNCDASLAMDYLTQIFRPRTPNYPIDIRLNSRCMTRRVRKILADAWERSALDSPRKLNERYILSSFLDDGGGSTAIVLKYYCRIDLDMLRACVRDGSDN